MCKICWPIFWYWIKSRHVIMHFWSHNNLTFWILFSEIQNYFAAFWTDQDFGTSVRIWSCSLLFETFSFSSVHMVSSVFVWMSLVNSKLSVSKSDSVTFNIVASFLETASPTCFSFLFPTAGFDDDFTEWIFIGDTSMSHKVLLNSCWLYWKIFLKYIFSITYFYIFFCRFPIWC